MLANSNLNDGTTRVKEELLSRAAEASQAFKYTSFEIAWHEWVYGVTVDSAMAVFVK